MMDATVVIFHQQVGTFIVQESRCVNGGGVNVGFALILDFFFFQAEDGIRDVAVTGVQTCALPIWMMLVVVSLTLGSTWVLGNADANPVGKGLLVVTNQKEHTVLVVDPDARRELAKVVVGVNGHEVMVSKDGRFAYVPIYGNSGVGRPGTDGSTIDVVDLQARKLAATIDLGKPLRPHRAEWGPDGMLYVTAELGNAVDVLDPNTRKVVAEIPTGQQESHMLVISPDGRRAYTANVGAGSVSVLGLDRKSTRLNSSHGYISYAVFCLKKKNTG